MTNSQVKICGITTITDANFSISFGDLNTKKGFTCRRNTRAPRRPIRTCRTAAPPPPSRWFAPQIQIQMQTQIQISIQKQIKTKTVGLTVDKYFKLCH